MEDIHNETRLRKRIQKVLLETYESNQFVIVNTNPKISLTELPKMFYNVQN